MLFTTKYAPNKLAEVIGQQLAVSQLKDYVVNYQRQDKRAILLWGPIGCGKTCSVYALAHELNYDLLEINSSDLRDQESIRTFLQAALGQRSLLFKPKLILIDEIDNISGIADRGCIPAVLKSVERSTFPVILTANDPFDKKFKELKNSCYLVQYQPIDYVSITELLEKVCAAESINYERKALHSLARQSGGDVRAALLDLHTCSQKLSFAEVSKLTDRNRTSSILQALTIIFKSSTVQNALPALENVDIDLGEVMFWLDHNLPLEYRDAVSLAQAYEWLARADQFYGRIKLRQHWRFLTYVNDLLTAGISSAKIAKNNSFVKYMPTMRILRMWQAKMKNARAKEISEKLAAVSHISKHKAREQLSYLKQIIGNEQHTNLALELELTAEEVSWLNK